MRKPKTLWIILLTLFLTGCPVANLSAGKDVNGLDTFKPETLPINAVSGSILNPGVSLFGLIAPRAGYSIVVDWYKFSVRGDSVLAAPGSMSIVFVDNLPSTWKRELSSLYFSGAPVAGLLYDSGQILTLGAYKLPVGAMLFLSIPTALTGELNYTVAYHYE